MNQIKISCLNPDSSRSNFAKWGIYAAAAGASLAMSTQAQACSIVGSGSIDQVLEEGFCSTSTQTFKVGSHKVVATLLASGSQGHVGLQPVSNQLLFARQNGVAVKFNQGDPINFTGGYSFALLRHVSPSSGNFGPGDVNGFVGFRDSDNHFGWIQVEVSDTGSPGVPNELQILGWAYDETPNETILAGQTTSVPEPGTAALGVLALGAAALTAWRHRKADVTKERRQAES